MGLQSLRGQYDRAWCWWPLTVTLMACVAGIFPAWGQQTPGGIPRTGPGLFQDRGVAGVGLGQPGQPGQPGVGVGQPGARPGTGPQGPSGMQSTGDLSAPVTSVRATGGPGVRITAGTQAFEPVQKRAVDYPELPDSEDFEPLSLTGPMPVVEFIDTITLVTGWNYVVTPQALNFALPSFQINEMLPGQAMEILQFTDLYYTFDAQKNFLKVMTKREYLEDTYGRPVEATFQVQHVNLQDAEQVVTAYKSPTGRLLVDTRTATLYVEDTVDNLRYMERAIRDLDVPMSTRTYPLIHINAEAVLDVVEGMLSEQGELRIDPRTNIITVTDQPIRLGRIAEMLETLDQQLETRSWVLNYASAEVIADQVALLIPDEMGLITINEDIHQITVTAMSHRLDEVDRLIRLWDVKRSQVMIEVYLLTAQQDVARNLGIRWSYFGEIGGDLFGLQVGGNSAPRFTTPPASGSQNFSIGQLPWGRRLLDPVTGEPLQDIQGNPLFREFRGSDVSVVVDYLENRGQVTVLAQPRVTVQDGQEAVFQNVTQVPFSQSAADRPISIAQPDGTIGTSFRSISRIEFIDVGTILRVLPRIAQEGNVLLDVSAEDSSFVPVTVIGSGEPNTVPQKTQNRTETQVMVRNQETIVIGGLRTTNLTDDLDKVPVLGDIPLLGRLFRSTSKEHNDRELLIFITPTIVDVTTHPEAIRLGQAEDEMARTRRFDQKNAFQQIREKLTDGRDEMLVAIGQQGQMLIEGRLVTFDDLRRAFHEVPDPLRMTVVIRKHPRAPEEVTLELEALALEAGLKVDYDYYTTPFVPALPQGPGPDVVMRR